MISTKDRIDVILSEIEFAKSQLREHDTGHIHTSIHWLEHRLDQLRTLRVHQDDTLEYQYKNLSYDELTVESDKYW